MESGIIVRALSGTYTVKIDPSDNQQRGVVDSAAESRICKPRGVFRKQGITPFVGDRVSVQGTTIAEVLPRKNVFERPPVSNIDAFVIIASQALPIADTVVLDTMIALAEFKNCEPIIVLNKCDIDAADALYDTYSGAGFLTIRVSAETGLGIAELSEAIVGKICAFAGNTGVGKSSIINALSNLALATGEISGKLKRGRHTTRTTELFELPNGAYVIDTAGFGIVEDTELAIEDVELAFREFEPYLGQCRFPDCRHLQEPECAVVGAVHTVKIARSRYASYVKLIEAAKMRWDTRYK